MLPKHKVTHCVIKDHNEWLFITHRRATVPKISNTNNRKTCIKCM